jgi:hypothetical protein
MKCTCKDRTNWWVRQWLACWHYIGAKRRTYRRATSSLIQCNGCLKTWRTSAKYVDNLPKRYETPYITSLKGDIVWKEK